MKLWAHCDRCETAGAPASSYSYSTPSMFYGMNAHPAQNGNAAPRETTTAYIPPPGWWSGTLPQYGAAVLCASCFELVGAGITELMAGFKRVSENT